VAASMAFDRVPPPPALTAHPQPTALDGCFLAFTAATFGVGAAGVLGAATLILLESAGAGKSVIGLGTECLPCFMLAGASFFAALFLLWRLLRGRRPRYAGTLLITVLLFFLGLAGIALLVTRSPSYLIP